MIAIQKELAEVNRKLEHIANAVADASAITDYNIMMGNLEDPSEEEEEEE